MCLLLSGAELFAQGNTCASATPFCSNGLNPYPAGVNVPAPPIGNNYDCLFTQPNPAWFYINITQNGSLSFVLDNTGNQDIDFVLYGPFPNLGAAIGQCGGLGNGGASGAIADCSYSGAAIEPVNVANVVAGEVYILLVTNFSNQPTTIFATPNAGSGDYGCDCETDVHYALAPPGFNDAALVDTTQYDADFVVCAGGQVGFTIDVQADSIVDSIGIYLPNTNLGAVFGPSNVAVFGPTYPIPGRYDSANFVVLIQTDSTLVGDNSGILSILNSGCVQDLNIRIRVVGINAIAQDTSVCAGVAQDIQLTGNSFSTSGGSYQWTQLSGPTVTFDDDTIQNPIISIPIGTVAGDSVVLQASFASAPDSILPVSCTSTDQVTIYFVNGLLNVNAMASDLSLCQNGLPNALTFNSSISGFGVDSASAVYTWTSIPAAATTMLSATNIANPTGNIVGNPGDVIQYVLDANYGACAGSDTITLNFGTWVADVTPATDTVCPGDNVPLVATPGPSNCSPVYTVTSIPYAPIPGAGTNSGISCDDCTSANLPIGFSFDFFCAPYTQFQVSSNGFITFDLAALNAGCCAGQLIPDAFGPNNVIALAWDDLDLSSCGSVTYFNTGTAPNRRLVVNFNNVCMFGSPNTVNVQAILYETTNVVEIHTTSITSNFNIMTQGIENAAGTAGFAIPGRNAADFSAGMDAYRFTPQVTFLPTYSWSPTATLSDTSSQNTSATPNANTTYVVSVTEGGCTMRDSSVIVVGAALPAPVVVCDSTGPNYVAFGWNAVPGAVSYEYSLDGGATWIATNNTFYLHSPMASGTSQTILVRGLAASGACITGPSTTHTCTTPCIFPAPVVNCDSSSVSSVAFSWPALVDANAGYQYSTDGGVTWTTTNNTFAIITGLTVGTVVNISVQGLSNNPNCSMSAIGTQSCAANSCNVPVVSIIETASIQCGSTTGAALSLNLSGGVATSFLWSNGATTDTIVGLSAGNYEVTATDATGSCSGTATYTVNAPLTPTLAAWVGLLGQDSTCIVQGEVIDINAGANESGVSYLWTPATDVADVNSAATTITANTAGTTVYTITAVSVDSCITTDQIILCVNPTGFGGIPSAFTPNGDGLNETFKAVDLIGATVSRFEIYNRWGEKIFDDPAAATANGWDGTKGGTPQARDVYMYILEYKFPADAIPTTLRGHVTLIR